jgi:NAD(P)-dependent dehydrogenase (short-subunit alcohol dehydrogenase family)
VRVVVITGTGQGIGAGVARTFAAAGYKVSLMSPSDRGVKLADQLGGIGRQGSALDPQDLSALIEETREAFGRIGAVVNNMGHGSGTPPGVTTSTVFDPDNFPDPLALPDETWHEALDMYVLGVVRMARVVTPLMVAQGGGSIVNISSMNATEPRPGYAQMSVLRASLHGFTKLFADKYARHSVRMNNVMPGYCENVPMSDGALRSIPMGRTARFDEIGQACVFLASDASSYVTGQSVCSSTAASIGVSAKETPVVAVRRSRAERQGAGEARDQARGRGGPRRTTGGTA